MKHIAFGQSYFSIGESLLSPEDLVTEAKASGHDYVALADTMTISGMIRFTQAAKKAGVTPIMGCRLRITDSLDRVKDSPSYYPIVYPQNSEGMRALFDILTKAHDEDHFYYVARISHAELLDLLRTGHFSLSTGSLLSVCQRQDASVLLDELIAACSANRTHLELTPIATPLFDKLNFVACREADRTGCPTLVTYPIKYKDADAARSMEVLLAITGNAKMDSPWLHRQFVKDFVVHPSKSIAQKCVESKARIEARYGAGVTGKHFGYGLTDGREGLISASRYEWHKEEVSLPQMADDEVAAFNQLVKQGFKERLTKPVLGFQPRYEDLTPYIHRCRSEMETLVNMGFVRYFLVVRDLVKWAKDNGIMVGPGRGSVGGSLVAYLLGITDVDPLRFGLYFERFINPERLDLPDADLDFMSARRHEVIDYLKKRYGEENVSGISNYATLGAASALRDSARVHGLMPYEYGCSKSIDKETLEEALETRPDVAKFSETYPEIWTHATRLQGVMRSLGRHAAGVVVAGVPLTERGVVERRNDEVTINWDKRTVEDMGLVKMDILGLSTLDMLERAQRFIEQETGNKIDYLDLPLDDLPTLKSFGSGDTVGVFQFESPGMRHLLRSLAKGGVCSFDDAVAATALYRPGPMESGLMDQYVAIAQGLQMPVYEHPNMRDALEPTNGVLIYQEQVMQIARDLCGFTMADSDHLRKAMGKKDPAAMAKQRDKFVKGALAHSGMGEREAGAIFDKIDKFAGYAFNKSHSVEYTIISYWAMWVKTHHPASFYAAQLSTTKEERLEPLVKDAMSHNIGVLPPDINYSEASEFNIVGNNLVAPFDRVKGMSDKTAAMLVKFRKKHGHLVRDRNELDSMLLAFPNGGKINKTVRDRLDLIGAFAHGKNPGPLDPSRLKDQKEFLPGLMVEVVKVDRTMKHDKFAQTKLMTILNECRACDKCDLKGLEHPWPKLGKKPSIMVITDCPNKGEAAGDAMMKGQGADYITRALHEAGLHMADFYFTALVKSPKQGQSLTNEQINACKGYLDREIEVLQPPVIIACGSKAIRHLSPSAKGGIDELCGQVHYDKDNDRSVVFGLTPGAIFIEPSRQEKLNEAFAKAAEIIGKSPEK